MLCALACTGKTPCHSRPESAKRCAQNVTFYEQKVITKVLILCHHVTQITPICALARLILRIAVPATPR